MKNSKHFRSLIALISIAFLFQGSALSQELIENPELDRQVEDFLASNRWYDMNVPTRDGQLLHDLIIQGKYTRALEIGTSTGHSGIWIAWALSKTGGKLITIDIDEGRHKKAVENFKKAGLSNYVDARLADAHQLVRELDGPFDFVFSDADKNWYKQYFLDVDPKLVVGGCYTTHNIRNTGRGGWSRDYYDFVLSLDNYESTLDTRGGGVLISYKRAD
jgi:predicted O-methyltransferase YrrM